MEKSALTTEKITIQSNDVRKESRNGFYESKEKNAKNVSIKMGHPTNENFKK